MSSNRLNQVWKSAHMNLLGRELVVPLVLMVKLAIVWIFQIASYDLVSSIHLLYKVGPFDASGWVPIYTPFLQRCSSYSCWQGNVSVPMALYGCPTCTENLEGLWNQLSNLFINFVWMICLAVYCELWALFASLFFFTTRYCRIFFASKLISLKVRAVFMYQGF